VNGLMTLDVKIMINFKRNAIAGLLLILGIGALYFGVEKWKDKNNTSESNAPKKTLEPIKENKTTKKSLVHPKTKTEKREVKKIKTPSVSFRLLSWNIQYGTDSGSRRNFWPERKKALRKILQKEKPNILCLQEALSPQISFIQKSFPDFKAIWVGRKDGQKEGETCAILFDSKRFTLLKQETFWLSDTPGVPSRTWGNKYFRICTSVKLFDLKNKASFSVCNTHFPLSAENQGKAADVIVKRLKRITTAGLPLILVGDFNCIASSSPRLKFKKLGLKNAEKKSQKFWKPTLHYRGLGLTPIDGIYHSKQLQVENYRVLSDKIKGSYPSDHFGVCVDIRPF